MTNHTELKRLAEAARYSWLDGHWHNHVTLNSGEILDAMDCDYVVAASPDVVLSMIAEIDRLRTQNQALVKEMRYIAGISNGQVKRVADQALAAQAEGGV